RCSEERDAKLRSLTQNIKMSQAEKVAPVRKTQLAYVDSAVKPPRSIISKQARYGTDRTPVVSPAARVAALKSASSNVAKAGDNRLRVAPGVRGYCPSSFPTDEAEKGSYDDEVLPGGRIGMVPDSVLRSEQLHFQVLLPRWPGMCAWRQLHTFRATVTCWMDCVDALARSERVVGWERSTGRRIRYGSGMVRRSSETMSEYWGEK
ncbi:hypothetical protein pipiens_012551, partial [Culex pipiens pipiens]